MIPAVSAYVKTAHSYTVPEVLALPVSGGSDEYLDWVRSSATGKGGAEK
jgi:periplasmic divalent cation tolerance protein